MKTDRRTFLKGAVVGLGLAIVAPLSLLKAKPTIAPSRLHDFDEGGKTLNENMAQRAARKLKEKHDECLREVFGLPPLQTFTNRNCKLIQKQKNRDTWEKIVVEVPMEYVVCSLGDKVRYVDDRGAPEGVVRRREPTCALSSRITIINPIYAKRVKAVRDGKVIEVFV